MTGYIPALAGMPRHNSDGIGGMHLYVPWWLYGDKKKDFPRGYHIELGGGFDLPQLGTFAGQCARHEGYGKALKQKIREEYGAFVNFAGRGEMIPNKDSYCDIDPTQDGRVGHPGAALPLHVDAARDQPDPPHAGHVHVDHPGDGRAGDGPAAGARTAPSRPAARSSTRRAPCRWARIRRPRC